MFTSQNVKRLSEKQFKILIANFISTEKPIHFLIKYLHSKTLSLHTFQSVHKLFVTRVIFAPLRVRYRPRGGLMVGLTVLEGWELLHIDQLLVPLRAGEGQHEAHGLAQPVELEVRHLGLAHRATQ